MACVTGVRCKAHLLLATLCLFLSNLKVMSAFWVHSYQLACVFPVFLVALEGPDSRVWEEQGAGSWSCPVTYTPFWLLLRD